ncbi:hypothetical protein, partial [Nocardia neocaledoniensis]|uniref:hypothetical protein n=1 Tax=Nocardia neocaledoniensis TaxID=236511 RepID=UPI00245675BD
RGVVGIKGEKFTGKKQQNQGSGDTARQDHEPPLALDHDPGVNRLSGAVAAPRPEPEPER